MKKLGINFLSFCCLFLNGWNISLAQQSGAIPSASADALYISGNILTGEGLLSAKPQRVSALAIRDGRITAIGNDQEILKFRGPKTKLIDLDGAFVMPGFNDAHVHLASGGFEKLNVDLVGVNSLEEMKERIAERVKIAAAGEWIKGRGWDHTKWKPQTLPTRGDIDAVTGGHPAIFTRVDGHIAIANTAALRAAGIGKDTHNPPGGKIDREPNGEPTGILREGAGDAVYDAIPKPTHAQRRKAIELALAEADSDSKKRKSYAQPSDENESVWNEYGPR